MGKLGDLDLDVTKAQPNYNGDSLLHIAIKKRNHELAKYLIQEGMPITDKNTYGESLIDHAMVQLINSRDMETKQVWIDFVSEILGVYSENCAELIATALRNVSTFDELKVSMLSIVPELVRNLKEGVNPLDLALTYPLLGRSIANELGEGRFEFWINTLPRHIALDLIKSLKFDLDESHLAHKVAIIPEKPNEEQYQMTALITILNELTSDPQKEEEFRKHLFPGDKKRDLQDILKSLEGFIENCNGKKNILGIEPGDEGAFWGRVEKAVTNTIKEISEKEANPKQILEKKAKLLGEYLNIIGYCATRLDVEFENLYHLNSGVVRSFQDEIYFLLSGKRARSVESLAPRHVQRVHFIQGMLQKLGQYNVPIPLSRDRFPQGLQLLDTESSFKMKYLDGLSEEIQNHLKSDKNSQKMFISWLEENDRTVLKPDLPAELANRFFEMVGAKVLPHNATKLERDLFAVCDTLDYVDEDSNVDFNDPAVRQTVIDTYFTQESWMKTDFATIKERGNDAFDDLDPDLQKAIEECQMKEKLHAFQNDTKAIPIERKRLMDKYKEIKQIDEATNTFFDSVRDFVKDHGELPPERDIPDNQKDLFALIELENDLNDPEVRKKLYLLNEQGRMNENFKEITKDGDSAFNNLDPALQQAIDELDMKDKLSLFQFTPDYQRSMKQKLLDKYKEIKFQNVTDENVNFLLQKLGVLKVAPDAPEWLQ